MIFPDLLSPIAENLCQSLNELENHTIKKMSHWEATISLYVEKTTLLIIWWSWQVIWTHDPRKSNKELLVFGGSFSEYEPLSNWGKFPLSYNGTIYPTLEHAFMHAKCVANGDSDAAQAVLNSAEPYQVKQIGDRVKLNRDIWKIQKSQEVMATLLKEKFVAGSSLAAELLQTGKLYLAKSGRDAIYACGLSITHKDVMKKAANTGKDRLGHLLMDIRHTLYDTTK